MRKQETYVMDQDHGLMGELLFRKAIGQFKPSIMTQMKETLQRNIHYNTLAYISDGIQQLNDPENLIPQAVWNIEGHSNYREGIKWHEALSETDSRILAERFDRDIHFQEFMGNTDPWSFHNLGAALGSAAFDPLSYVPFVAPFAKAGQAIHRGVRTAKAMRVSDIGASISFEGVMGNGTVAMQRLNTVNNISSTVNPLRASLGTIGRPFKPITRFSMEGVLAESSYQIIKNMADSRQSEDIDYMGGVFDIMIAGLFGGILGTIPMANTFRKNFRKEQLNMALAKSLDDIKHRGEVNLHGKSPDGDPQLTPEQAREQWDTEMAGLDESQAHIDDPTIHPIKSHFQTLGQDLKEGLKTAINAYRRCGA